MRIEKGEMRNFNYIINEGQSLGIKNEACGKIPKS
jgi:hypothetical protein